jgi:hypothetical protein
MFLLFIYSIDLFIIYLLLLIDDNYGQNFITWAVTVAKRLQMSSLRIIEAGICNMQLSGLAISNFDVQLIYKAAAHVDCKDNLANGICRHIIYLQ